MRIDARLVVPRRLIGSRGSAVVGIGLLSVLVDCRINRDRLFTLRAIESSCIEASDSR